MLYNIETKKALFCKCYFFLNRPIPIQIYDIISIFKCFIVELIIHCSKSHQFLPHPQTKLHPSNNFWKSHVNFTTPSQHVLRKCAFTLKFYLIKHYSLKKNAILYISISINTGEYKEEKISLNLTTYFIPSNIQTDMYVVLNKQNYITLLVTQLASSINTRLGALFYIDLYISRSFLMHSWNEYYILLIHLVRSMVMEIYMISILLLYSCLLLYQSISIIYHGVILSCSTFLCCYYTVLVLAYVKLIQIPS